MEQITNKLSDITDSREILESKVPIELRILLLVFIASIVSLFVALNFLYIDQYVSVSGQVLDKTSIANISISSKGGIVERVYVDQGNLVNEGDVLLNLDSTELIIQNKQVIENIKRLKLRIAGMEKLRESVNLNENKLASSNEELEFYQQYEQYQADIKNNQNTLSESQSDNNNSIEEIEISFGTISDNINNKNIVMNEISLLIDAVNGEYVYNSSDSYYATLFQSYRTNLKEINDSQDNSIEQSQGTTKAKLKNDFLLQLNEKYKIEETALTELNNEKSVKEQQLANLKEKNFHVDDSINKIKQDMLLSIENNISTTQDTLKVEEDKHASLDNDIKVNTIVATKSGIVNILNGINKGDVLSGNSNIMQIVPKKDKYFIQASIPENEIAKVKEGFEVNCKFNSIPYQEFGKISGKIIQISDAYFQNEDKTSNYFLAEVEIEKEELKNKKGELLELKTGMLADVEIITGNQTCMDWLLKKMNLRD